MGVNVGDTYFGQQSPGGNFLKRHIRQVAHRLDRGGMGQSESLDLVPDSVMLGHWVPDPGCQDLEYVVTPQSLELLAGKRWPAEDVQGRIEHPSEQTGLRLDRGACPSYGNPQGHQAHAGESQKLSPRERIRQFDSVSHAMTPSADLLQDSGRYGCTLTSVPTEAKLYSHSASGMVRLTQPRLMGVPKLLCQ